MSRLAVLEALDLGAPVAEQDDHLTSHYVQTRTLREVVHGRYDIILGQKGSGKSAILRIIRDAQASFAELSNVVLVEASNQEHLGNPVFRSVFEEFQTNRVDLTHHQPQLMDAWKVYILSLLWNRFGHDLGRELNGDLEKKWKSLAIVESDLLNQMRFAFARVLYFRAIEAQVGADGTFRGRIELPDRPPEDQVFIPFADLFLGINTALGRRGVQAWVVFDRLDEAFPGNEELERAGVRSILNAYKDLNAMNNLRIKMALREDLLGRATVGWGEGFRAMTHIRPRMSPTLRWDDPDLMRLIVQRFTKNPEVRRHFGIVEDGPLPPNEVEAVFYRLCPSQVNIGLKKPRTWVWIRNRLRDGQGIKTPRDLLSFFIHLSDIQIHIWQRDGEGAGNAPLFEAQAFKLALAELSKEKFNDHLLAENPHLSSVLQKFREQKAEYNAASLRGLLGDTWRTDTEALARAGFLEATGATWKVPLLYRAALNIVQGAQDSGEDEEG